MSFLNKMPFAVKHGLLLSLLLNTSTLMSMTEENVENIIRVNSTAAPSSSGTEIGKTLKTAGLGLALGTIEMASQISDGFKKIGSVFSGSDTEQDKWETFQQGFIQIGKSPLRAYKMGAEAKGVINISEQEPVIYSDKPTNTSPSTINGPKKEDRIVIVGAGPSGIHMAYILKEKGYNNVQIFEKSDRIGGKVLLLYVMESLKKWELATLLLRNMVN